MPISAIGDQTCSVARAIGLVGDPWTLLLVRELFLGSRRFDEFQTYTGISPHLLSVRMKGLEDAGIVERRAYQERPVRHEYRLTEMGVGLWTVISALREWGDRWSGSPGATPLKVRHQGCGGTARIKVTCDACEQDLGPRDVDLKMSRAATAERKAAPEIRAHRRAVLKSA